VVRASDGFETPDEIGDDLCWRRQTDAGGSHGRGTV
jgi:hypothetical protein